MIELWKVSRFKLVASESNYVKPPGGHYSLGGLTLQKAKAIEKQGVSWYLTQTASAKSYEPDSNFQRSFDKLTTLMG